MPWLSTQIRCDKCGVRLQDDRPQTCPSCHAHLVDEDDFSSEVKEWSKTRELGMARHVCLAGVLGFGIPILIVVICQQLFQRKIDFVGVVVMNFFSGLGVIVIAIYSWRGKEQEFAEYTQGTSSDKNRHPENRGNDVSAGGTTA